ncbi:MAG: hypothetical protein AB8B92_05955 [Gammaproteobacteria bacterium]
MPSAEDTINEKEKLTMAIYSLSNEISLTEATNTSHLLFNVTTNLAVEYNMESPALFHNMLVNTGARDRGLCCHWAEDLHLKLRMLNANSLKFDWLVSRLGSKLREHNTVVIYAADSNWSEGLVYDPWRKAGKPYWINVSDDKYPWLRHPLSGQWNVLRCK